MKKFIVVENKRYGANMFHQDLLLRNSDGALVQGCVFYSGGKVVPGTKIKKYFSNGVVAFEVAATYKINGRRYIDINWRPRTRTGIKEFWNTLGFFDGIRFHMDLKQALIQQKVLPTFSRHNNLLLFLGGGIINRR